MTTTFETGMWVWLPDEEDMYVAAKVLTSFKKGEAGKVETIDGDTRDVDAKTSEQCQVADEAALDNYDNMVKLNDLNEPTILHNLRQRYLKNEIYTYVGTILIAVNPFKLLPLYTPQVQDIYKEKGARDTPPHVYAIADNAYNNMLADRTNQSIVISGESGAGKTETMKLVLQYLAEVSGRAQKRTTGDNSESLEQQILKSNPVMEAFGNAKTVRNNNSSRFGKWTEISFNSQGAIVGGSIINYLLEKSRVPFQAEGERNYHIFYQLLAGGEVYPEMKAKLKLKEADDYHYLNQSGVTTVDNINDEKDYEELVNAMDVLNMTKDERDQTLELVSGVLHLGNVEFEPDPSATEDDGAKIKGDDLLALAASQLGVDPEKLGKSLCFKNIGGSREVIMVNYSLAKAADARDGCSKALYGALFDWLIQKINAALLAKMGSGDAAKSKDKITTIGVLDIFGFECFVTNSFEQMCINFCNEKLQFHFNEHIFKLEQDEYASEGITVEHIEFSDNQACLDLLELKSTGIFSMIDEEINIPRGSDEGFLSKVLQKHAKHANFARPKPKDKDARQVFIINHYAGAVPYNATNFLEKNKDSLHADIRAVMSSSTNPLTAALLPVAESGGGGGGGRGRGAASKRQLTLGTQFKQQLQALMTTLNGTDPHFVRCMKPNDKKIGDLFQSGMMLDQLRYAGLLEVCRIRQIGYPVRKAFADFVFRYRCLALTAAKDHNTLLAALAEKGLAKEGQWQVGHTKVFMRNMQQTIFEAAREDALKDVVTKIQTTARRFIVRCRWIKWAAIMKTLREAIAARELEALETALGDVPELPNLGKGAGLHLKVVQDAVALKERLELELRVTGLLQQAIADRDLAALQSALSMATDMAFESPVVAEAKTLVARLQEERACLAALKTAVETRDKPALTAGLEKAAALDLQATDVYKQAVALKQRMEEEEAALEALKAAMGTRTLEALTPAIDKLVAMGLGSNDVVTEAQALKDFLTRQAEARAALKEAVAARTLEDLDTALATAAKAELPADCEEMVAAQACKAKLLEEQAMREELTKAAETGSLEVLQAALAKASGMGVVDGPAVTKAKQRLDRLEQEAACVTALVDAVKANKAGPLSAAVSTANELGLTDIPEYAKAEKALGKFAAQNKSLQAIAEATKSGDLDALAAAIEGAQKTGLGDDDQVKSAIALQAKLQEARALVEELTKAATAHDEDALTPLLEKANGLGLSKRYPEQLAAATAAADRLEAEAKAAAAIRSAIKAKDSEALDAAAAKAAELGDAKGAKLQAAIGEAAAATKRFAEQAALTVELEAALEAKDKDKLKDLLATAKTLELDNSATRRAEAIVDREKIVAKTLADLSKACAKFDLDGLNAAMERVIELGIEGEQVEEAKALRTRLDEEKEMAASLNAAMTMIKAKLEGRQPIDAGELAPLQAAIEEAEGNGLREDSPAMLAGQELKRRVEGVLVLQEEMQAALDTPDTKLSALRKLMERAETLEVSHNMVLVKSMRTLIRDKEHARSQKAMMEEELDDDIPTLDDEEAARLREEKMRKAKQAKYHWTKFPNIRDPDDFAKGVLLNKKKVKQNQLRWQSSVIPRSLYDFQGDKELSKLSTRIHKALLGYSGDKSMSFPATLAQDILQKGLEIPDLVDEIYLQICKHLTHNPRPESGQRGWQVLCMAVGTFPPSRDFENYLLNFILQHRDGSGAIGNYARYSLRRLEGILNSGPSGFVPSVDEIQAYKERPPILATIELVDGTPLTEDLPITPDLNVSKVLDICTHFMELRDPRMQYFGIYVEDVNDTDESEVQNPLGKQEKEPWDQLPKSPRPLQNENFMGDVVTVKVRQGQAFKFVFKRKIFLKHMDDMSDDAMYERLVYLQAADEVIIGNIPIGSEAEVSLLVAQAMAIDLGDEMPDTPDALVLADIQEYIPEPWREKKSLEDWASEVLKHRDSVVDEDAEELQAAFVESVKDHPLYGTNFFHVKKHTFPDAMSTFPDRLIVAFNSEGLHFLNEDRETLASFGYADIYRWGGSSTQFSIIIWNAETQDTDDVSMYTSQAADMAALILDYINAIMATTEG